MLLFVTKNMARTRKLRQRQDDIVSYQFWTMTDRCLHAFVGSTPPMNKNVSFCIFFFFSLKIKIFIVLVCLWSNFSFNLFLLFCSFSTSSSSFIFYFNFPPSKVISLSTPTPIFNWWKQINFRFSPFLFFFFLLFFFFSLLLVTKSH